MKEVFLWWGGTIVKAMVKKEDGQSIEVLVDDYGNDVDIGLRFPKEEVSISFDAAKSKCLEKLFSEHRRLMNMLSRSNDRITRLQKLNEKDCLKFTLEAAQDL